MPQKTDNLIVVIPAFNEEKAIKSVIAEIQGLGLKVLIIDDGSTDQTQDVAHEQGAEVLVNDANEGKGASIKRGMNYVFSNGYDAAILMDGDGQHSPLDLSNFVEKYLEGFRGIIIGTRMRDTHDMPTIRRLTNLFMSFLISAVARVHVTDTQSGYRLLTREAWQLLELNTSRFDTESEMILEGSRKRIAIEEVPIQTIYGQQSSSINPFFDTIRFFRLISVHFLLKHWKKK